MEQIINAIISNAVSIVAAIVIGLAGVALQYLKVLIATKLKMDTLAKAIAELDGDIAGVVGELQQTVVDDLKAAAADGKLTQDEIRMLKQDLLEGVRDRLSDDATAIIEAAGIDIHNYILSEAEAVIHSIKAIEA